MNNKYIFGFFLLVLIVLIAKTAHIPLVGSHQWRQADTNFMSYAFCTETSNILSPRVAMRAETDGVTIGEFPLYNWITGMSCRALGGWSEFLPKVVSFVFMISSAVVWALVFAPLGSALFWSWMILFCFSCLSLIFLNHAMPEGLALLCTGLAALTWKKSGRRDVLGAILFTLGFLIRPYLVGLLFLSARTRKQYILAFPLILCAYAFWYKYWAGMYSTPYFLITPKPFLEALGELPTALLAFGVHLAKLHLNWIALPVFIYGAFKNPRFAGLGLLSALIVFMASGYHFDLHPYYLFATLIFALVLVVEGLQKLKLKPVFVSLFLFIFGAISLSGRAHEFFAPHDTYWEQIPKLIGEVGIGPNERLTTADGWNPIWLYYAKRPGYAVEPGAASCMGSSVAMLYKEADQVRVKECGVRQ